MGNRLSAAPRRLLLIDDEPEIREAVMRVLKEVEGLEVVAPETLAECFAIAKDRRSDIALVDNSLVFPGYQPEPWTGNPNDTARGWQVANDLRRTNPDMKRLGFSRSGMLNMGPFVEASFGGKAKQDLLRRDNAEIREGAEQDLARFIREHVGATRKM